MQPQENSHHIDNVEKRFPSNARSKTAERLPSQFETHHDKLYYENTVLNERVYCLFTQEQSTPWEKTTRALPDTKTHVARSTSTITTNIAQVSDENSVILHARFPYMWLRPQNGDGAKTEILLQCISQRRSPMRSCSAHRVPQIPPPNSDNIGIHKRNAVENVQSIPDRINFKIHNCSTCRLFGGEQHHR